MKKVLPVLLLVLVMSGCQPEPLTVAPTIQTETTQEPESVAPPTEASTTESPTEPSSEAPEKRAATVVLDEPIVLFTVPVNDNVDVNTLKAMVFTPLDPLPEGVTIEEQDHYEYGPEAFAVRSDEEAFVLDTYNSRVLWLKKGSGTKAKTFAYQETGSLLKTILVRDDCVYVIGDDGIGCWNTKTNVTTYYPLRFIGRKRFRPGRLSWQDGLVVENEYQGELNYRLDEERGVLEATSDGYSYSPMAIDGKEERITYAETEWVIPCEKQWVSVVGQGPGKSLFVLANDKEVKDGRWSETFVLEYGAKETGKTSDEALSSVKIPMASLWWPPSRMVTVGPDGVYAFLVEEKTAKIVKLISFEMAD